MAKEIPYPSVICHDCGLKYGIRKNFINFVATFYVAKCGICEMETSCTEPRDYWHLDAIKCSLDDIKLILD